MYISGKVVRKLNLMALPEKDVGVRTFSSAKEKSRTFVLFTS